LFYGTGGWAWSSDQFVRTQLAGTVNLATAGTDEAVNTYLSGWTAGAGIAVAFTQNWNAFAEYRYTNYASTTITLPFSQVSTTFSNKVSEVDVGVNYKFNWSAPVPANSAPLYNYADKPALVVKAPAVTRAFSWTGFYVGADGGYGWRPSNGTLTDAAGTVLVSYGYTANGPFAGIFGGGNYQFNQFVIGVEGDWQKSSMTGNNEQQAALGAAGAFPAGPFTVSTTIKDSESMRGRIGVAFGRAMVFGTAGWSWGDPSVHYTLLGSAPFVSNGGSASGWTAGAGLDYAFTDHIFGRFEYRYSELGFAGFVNAAANAADSASKAPINDVRVGFAYKFGPFFGKY
jgi:outer membrane immunogenic protein